MSKRFRVAFSFVREKRDFVEQVAVILAKRFGEDRILYDKFHEAEFARADLTFYLPPFYRDQSDLVVIVISKDFDTKEWPGLEWKVLYSLLKERKHGEVMLCRFDGVKGKGLYGLAGYIELDDKTPTALASLILQRLAVNEENPKDFYTRGAPVDAAWPKDAPPGSDVFISYSNEDAMRVQILASALKAEGWSVFWDQEIPYGEDWESYIGPRLAKAQVVIVVWSHTSVKSRFVREEATRAFRRNVLIPVRIDPVDQPFGFGHMNAADLMEWLTANEGTLPTRLKSSILHKLAAAERLFRLAADQGHAVGSLQSAVKATKAGERSPGAEAFDAVGEWVGRYSAGQDLRLQIKEQTSSDFRGSMIYDDGTLTDVQGSIVHRMPSIDATWISSIGNPEDSEFFAVRFRETAILRGNVQLDGEYLAYASETTMRGQWVSAGRSFGSFTLRLQMPSRA